MGRPIRIFRPFAVALSSWEEKTTTLIEMLKVIRFDRVLVVTKSRESTRFARDALEGASSREASSPPRTPPRDAEEAVENAGSKSRHAFRVISVDEQSSERHRSDQLREFFERHGPVVEAADDDDDVVRRRGPGVVMVTTETEVDLESTLANLVGVSLVVVWADRTPATPDAPSDELNPDFLKICVEGSIPAVYFVAPDAKGRAGAPVYDLSYAP